MLKELAKQFKQHFPELCQIRPKNSHKGDYGSALIIGGAPSMAGALLLAGSACQYLGSGKTHLIFCQKKHHPQLFEQHPELMIHPLNTLKKELNNKTSIAIGCGLGQSPLALKTLHTLLKKRQAPIIIDADALNLLAQHQNLKKYTQNAILTPHPKEAAHLLSCDTQTILKNRLKSAQKLSEHYHAWIILKGHKTLIVSPEQKHYTNPTGNAGLASAGTGDVLTGIITSLIAQKIPTEIACRASVWLHGAAAELLGKGQALAGLRASEIAPIARLIRHTATIM